MAVSQFVKAIGGQPEARSVMIGCNAQPVAMLFEWRLLTDDAVCMLEMECKFQVVQDGGTYRRSGFSLPSVQCLNVLNVCLYANHSVCQR